MPRLLPISAVPGHEGVPYDGFSNSFTHGSNTEPVSDFTATIVWGDGTSSAGTVSLVGGAYFVAGSHAYQDEGRFTVSGVVTDTSGGASLSLGGIAFIREALLPDGTEGTANQRFVSEVYNDLLHRAVDADGLTFWSAQLDAGATRAQIAMGIENSDEYRHDEIDSLYVHYLHRHVEPQALDVDNKVLAQGGTDEQLAALLAGSDEYFANRGGGTNDGFVNALFEDTLNRPIDPAAKTAFEQFLANGMTREQAAAVVFGSHEYHADLVEQMYLDVLDRSAEPRGQSYWAGQLDRGFTDEEVLADLVASDEYFAKTS